MGYDSCANANDNTNNLISAKYYKMRWGDKGSHSPRCVTERIEISNHGELGHYDANSTKSYRCLNRWATVLQYFKKS